MEYEKWLKSFLNNSDPATKYDMEMAHSYTYKLKNNICISENIDLSNQKSLERYNKFVKLVISKNPKEYKINDFKSISKNETIYLFKNIIYMILGKTEFIDNLLNNFINLIFINGSDNPMDGQVIQLYDMKTNNIVYSVRINNLETVASVVCLSHEFMHYYEMINKMDLNKKTYYDEILSIFAEKFASYVLEGQGSSDIVNKIENNRLDVIKFHYTERPKDVEETRLFAEKFNDENLYKFYKEYKIYSKVIAESYGFGYIYGEGLFQLYLTDINFRNDFSNMLNKKISLQEILNKYSINMENKDIIELSKKKMRLALK